MLTVVTSNSRIKLEIELSHFQLKYHKNICYSMLLDLVKFKYDTSVTIEWELFCENKYM